MTNKKESLRTSGGIPFLTHIVNCTTQNTA